jgi:hypothetical protein
VAEADRIITLIFIINGENISVKTNVEAHLAEAVERALSESRNTGRPPSEWEVRDASGVFLEISRKIKELGLKDGTRLFLSLRVGAGGIDATGS